jgi:hypothetical protein
MTIEGKTKTFGVEKIPMMIIIIIYKEVLTTDFEVTEEVV